MDQCRECFFFPRDFFLFHFFFFHFFFFKRAFSFGIMEEKVTNVPPRKEIQ